MNKTILSEKKAHIVPISPPNCSLRNQLAILVDFILRFIWMARYLAIQIMSIEMICLWFELLEIFRRFIWIFLRVNKEYEDRLNPSDRSENTQKEL